MTRMTFVTPATPASDFHFGADEMTLVTLVPLVQMISRFLVGMQCFFFNDPDDL